MFWQFRWKISSLLEYLLLSLRWITSLLFVPVFYLYTIYHNNRYLWYLEYQVLSRLIRVENFEMVWIMSWWHYWALTTDWQPHIILRLDLSVNIVYILCWKYLILVVCLSTNSVRFHKTTLLKLQTLKLLEPASSRVELFNHVRRVNGFSAIVPTCRDWLIYKQNKTTDICKELTYMSLNLAL